MIEHFVTLFNSKYLPQGLSLLSSMEKNVINFRLWILCIDDEAYQILKKLNYEHVNPLKLSDFETEDLLTAKKNRTFTEYCWTLTPFTFDFVYKCDNTIKRLTYIDADMYFFNDTRQIFTNFEKSNKSILITKHNYSPFYDQSNFSGKFCVQFLTIDFEFGEKVRKDWELKCLDWCYNRFENGKFGDQKYLDRWPIDFKELVYIVDQKDLFLAPWNALQFSTDEIVAFHFHGLKILNNHKINIGNYLIPISTYQYIYKEYLDSIFDSIKILENLNFYNFIQQRSSLILKIKSLMSVPYFFIRLFKYSHIIKK